MGAKGSSDPGQGPGGPGFAAGQGYHGRDLQPLRDQPHLSLQATGPGHGGHRGGTGRRGEAVLLSPGAAVRTGTEPGERAHRRPGHGYGGFKKKPLMPGEVRLLHDQGLSYGRLGNVLALPKSTLAAGVGAGEARPVLRRTGPQWTRSCA